MNAAIEERLAALGFRSSEVAERFVLGTGRGGQKLQKTSNVVWLRHGPTGVEVRCDQERSQTANRKAAWWALCAKLAERRRVAAANLQHEQQKAARRERQKSFHQKARMIAGKKHRAGIKKARNWSGED